MFKTVRISFKQEGKVQGAGLTLSIATVVGSNLFLPALGKAGAGLELSPLRIASFPWSSSRDEQPQSQQLAALLSFFLLFRLKRGETCARRCEDYLVSS